MRVLCCRGGRGGGGLAGRCGGRGSGRLACCGREAVLADSLSGGVGRCCRRRRCGLLGRHLDDHRRRRLRGRAAAPRRRGGRVGARGGRAGGAARARAAEARRLRLVDFGKVASAALAVAGAEHRAARRPGGVVRDRAAAAVDDRSARGGREAVEGARVERRDGARVGGGGRRRGRVGVALAMRLRCLARGLCCFVRGW